MSSASTGLGRRIARRPRPTTGFHSAVPFLVPSVLLLAVFLFYPMLSNVYMSFFEWNGFTTTQPVFVGVENYVRVFTQDPVFWRSVTNTAVWLVLSLTITTLISLLLALAMNRRLLGRNVFRSIFYIPGVLASIAVASIWVWMYNPQQGAINSGLAAIGLGKFAPQWLGDPNLALFSVFIAFAWQTVGFNMVLFLAGLQGVPQELVEAARVDGANRFQVFRAVILPALRPTALIVFVLTMISSLKVFDLIVGMTNGGPAQSTQVLALWSFTQSIHNHLFGVGDAIATVLLVLSLVMVVPYLIWFLREDRA